MVRRLGEGHRGGLGDGPEGGGGAERACRAGRAGWETSGRADGCLCRRRRGRCRRCRRRRRCVESRAHGSCRFSLLLFYAESKSGDGSLHTKEPEQIKGERGWNETQKKRTRAMDGKPSPPEVSLFVEIKKKVMSSGKFPPLFFSFFFSFLHHSPHRREPPKQARPGHHRHPRGGVGQRRGGVPALPGQGGGGGEADGDASEPAGEAVFFHFFYFFCKFSLLPFLKTLLRALDLGEASLLGGLFLQGLEGLGFLFSEVGERERERNEERERDRERVVSEFSKEVVVEKEKQATSTVERATRGTKGKKTALSRHKTHLPLLRLEGEVVVVEVGLVGLWLLERL